VTIPRSFRLEIISRRQFGEWRHTYLLEGARGAVHFHVTSSSHDKGRFYGGVEMHSPKPIHDEDKAPDHGSCTALSGRACWHDGSSTMAEAQFIPLWEGCVRSGDFYDADWDGERYVGHTSYQCVGRFA